MALALAKTPEHCPVLRWKSSSTINHPHTREWGRREYRRCVRIETVSENGSSQTGLDRLSERRSSVRTRWCLSEIYTKARTITRASMKFNGDVPEFNRSTDHHERKSVSSQRASMPKTQGLVRSSGLPEPLHLSGPRFPYVRLSPWGRLETFINLEGRHLARLPVDWRAADWDGVK